MSYSRFSDSSWYIYPTTHDGQPEIVCMRASGFDTYFWERGISYDQFVAEVAASMRHDEFYYADLAELKEILLKNIEDIKKELGHAE